MGYVRSLAGKLKIPNYRDHFPPGNTRETNISEPSEKEHRRLKSAIRRGHVYMLAPWRVDVKTHPISMKN